jgi:diguanylate cyclase (GGDEF)-like protein/PAS domain S-box-containing protein
MSPTRDAPAALPHVLAGLLLVIVALFPPIFVGLTQYQGLQATLAAEANALGVTAVRTIGRNPTIWRYTLERLQYPLRELYNPERYLRVRTIEGAELFAFGEPVTNYPIVHTETLTEFGEPVGYLDLVGSVSPVVHAVAKTALISLVLSGLVLLPAYLVLTRRLKASVRQTAAARNRLELIVSTTADGIALVDFANLTVIECNDAFLNILGIRRNGSDRQPFRLDRPHEDMRALRDHLEKAYAHDLLEEAFSLHHGNGATIRVLLTTRKVEDRGEVRLHLTLRDISREYEAEERIRQLAYYDPLTDLPNRRLLIDRLRQAMAMGQRHKSYSAIMFIDLDRFKILNDTKGHQYGDMMLKEVAERIERVVRECDTVARQGGDEFIVLLEELGSDEEHAALAARDIGEKILASLNQGYSLAEVEHLSSASMGISLFQGKGVAADVLLSQADTAMYEAKRSGRNALRFFDPEMQKTLEHRITLETALRKAAAAEDFALFYQPVVNESGTMIGAEALIRWPHPTLGLVSPAQFIPLAEETQLIVPIGWWVVEEACRQLMRWQQDARFRHLTLSINISAQQFQQPDFVEAMLLRIAQHAVPPGKLKLELTESIVIHDVELSVEKMHRLRAAGLQLSMDDFGTGYSSLSYLRKLPFNQIKIDRAFTARIEHESCDAFIVLTILTLGRLMQMEIVAEGVETPEQFESLRGLGCTGFQGYFFAQPLPIDQFQQLDQVLVEALPAA